MLRTRAQGLSEYALIILLIAVAAVIGVTAFGTQISAVISSITGSL